MWRGLVVRAISDVPLKIYIDDEDTKGFDTIEVVVDIEKVDRALSRKRKVDGENTKALRRAVGKDRKLAKARG